MHIFSSLYSWAHTHHIQLYIRQLTKIMTFQASALFHSFISNVQWWPLFLFTDIYPPQSLPMTQFSFQTFPLCLWKAFLHIIFPTECQSLFKISHECFFFFLLRTEPLFFYLTFFSFFFLIFSKFLTFHCFLKNPSKECLFNPPPPRFIYIFSLCWFWIVFKIKISANKKHW